MPSTRRTLLIAATSAIVPAVLRPGAARAEDPRETPRFMGSPDAKVTATEWYSMTCPHCARFAAEVFPQIKAQLIDTGKLKYVFGDFPLDQLALTAAMVARTLPADRYEPFRSEVFPQIKAQLIDTGKLKYVFGDFPLDQLALTAAMVARTLPADRYEPFVMS